MSESEQELLVRMKFNFVVSGHRDIWIPNAKCLFALNAYIVHILERDGLVPGYEEIQVAKAPRPTRDEFQFDHDFVDLKYREYMPILVRRLDELHGTLHGKQFWERALALSILRHVTLCYDLFKACEAHLDLKVHDCFVLDQANYFIPSEFDAHRQYFQNTDLGREQLFSVYCKIFYPGRFVSWVRPDPPGNPIAERSKQRRLNSVLAKLTPRRLILGLARRLHGFSLGVYRSLGARPKVGIMDCSFAEKNVERLIRESRGRIRSIASPVIPASTSSPLWSAREILSRPEQEFDRFDNFVFECLRHGMPKMFVEDFKQTYTDFYSHFSRYQTLSWVVCEWWIGHAASSFALAVLSKSGVKHISHEHNYLSHIFLGANIKYLASLADEYVTLGWADSATPNLVRGASLFPWAEEDPGCIKEHEILFVLTAPIAYIPEMSATYGNQGATGVLAYFEMNVRFLEGLGEETLASLYIRSYPLKESRCWTVWDQRFVLAPYIDKVKEYDDCQPISGRMLMQRSRLVVVSYLATSYLESMIANIPTIFFWKKDFNLLSEKYSDAFQGLIDVGICQTDPEDAALFVNKIKDHPDIWWNSETVRKSREEFLRTNIGDPECMIQYLLDKARTA